MRVAPIRWRELPNAQSHTAHAAERRNLPNDAYCRSTHTAELRANRGSAELHTADSPSARRMAGRGVRQTAVFGSMRRSAGCAAWFCAVRKFVPYGLALYRDAKDSSLGSNDALVT